MQRWEYLNVFMKRLEWTDSLGRSGDLPARGSSVTGDPTGLLNELGGQGWELTGIASGDGNDVYQLFLKRPKP